jgi:hypothetical protein
MIKRRRQGREFAGWGALSNGLVNMFGQRKGWAKCSGKSLEGRKKSV